MTSLLIPDVNQLRLFTGFPEWGSVVEEVDVQTHRLDDLDIDEFDLLKIDIQGAELMVLQNGLQTMKDALVIHTEVEFMPLYTGQPLFGEVDQFLRSQGFVFHRFVEEISRVLKPLSINNNVHAGLSQLFWADAVYIRDFTRLDLLAPEQLLRLAAILHECYRSYDLALHFLTEYDRRIGTHFGDTYLADGLKAKAVS